MMDIAIAMEQQDGWGTGGGGKAAVKLVCSPQVFVRILSQPRRCGGGTRRGEQREGWEAGSQGRQSGLWRPVYVSIFDIT